MVSSPSPVNESPEEITLSIQGCYKTIYANEFGQWKSYDPTKPINSLEIISPLQGFWIEVNCTEVDWRTN